MVEFLRIKMKEEVNGQSEEFHFGDHSERAQYVAKQSESLSDDTCLGAINLPLPSSIIKLFCYLAIIQFDL